MSSDKQMKRGKTQSLYKYLPDSWIDFSVRGKDRKQYIAKVERWNSKELVGINSRRLIRIVNHAVQSYASQGKADSSISPISGFGAELTQENCDVLTPKVSDVERGVIAKISPLTFYCKKCKKVSQFNTVGDYNKNRYCKNCQIELTQFRQIYFCQCGYATDKHPKCKAHGFSNLYWDGEYSFICKTCKKKIPMQVKCPICGSPLRPKVALDPAQFFTYSLSLIDLIDEKLEEFISKTDYGKYITIAFFLGKISRDQLDEVIDKGITSDPEKYKIEYEKNLQMFKAFLNEQDAINAAKATTDKECGNAYNAIIEDIKGKLFTTTANVEQMAEMVLEHSMVKMLKELGNKVSIFSFPMRYIPLSHVKRGYIGSKWNAKYLRSLQRMLTPTQGKGVSSRSFFEADFGTSSEEFLMFLSMPEEHLGWRGHFAKRKNETDTEMKKRKIIWDENQQYLVEWKRRFQALGETKEEFIRYIGDNSYTIERFLRIKDIEQKKLFIHYFSFTTLLKLFMINDLEEKKVVIEYITEDFPLIYERMIRYITDSKIPYSLLEGLFRSFGAKFVQSIFEYIDFSSEEEPSVIGSLIKAQKKAQVKVFKFELIRSFHLYKQCGALRKKDITEMVTAIRNLDEEKVRSVLEERFNIFKRILLKKATEGEVGTEYVAAQISRQLSEFCKQVSLFEEAK